ncbi:MAG: hypothetical protein QM767_26470 [Anaeromyxobacter sp.]
MLARPPSQDLARITLGVASIVLLFAASTWVLLPFVAATVWATMITVATWPMLLGVQRRLGGRRGLAVATLVVLLAAVVIAPIWLGLSTIAENIDGVANAAREVAVNGLPPPPAWVEGLPLVGNRIRPHGPTCPAIRPAWPRAWRRTWPRPPAGSPPAPAAWARRWCSCC